MVRIQSEIKRGFLRQIFESIHGKDIPLRDALVGFQGQIFSENFKRGRLLISTSGSGQSGSFEISIQGKDFTQPNVFSMAEEFIAACDDAIAAGAVNNSDTFNAMMVDDRLLGCREAGGDFTLIGLSQYGFR